MSFDTLVNFRDLGDYKVADGRQIAPRKLLRSGELSDLSAHDIDLLVDTYKLRQIVDFRSMGEVEKRPDVDVPHATYHHIDMFKGDGDDAPALENMKGMNEAATADERMMFAYKHLIVSPVAQRGFRQFFDIMLNNAEGSTIWHCFAGKDRTGLAGALVLHLLGADQATILEDYLRTNESRKKANDKILAEMRANDASKAQLADTLVMLTVKQAYLDYALQVIHEEYQTLDNYVGNILGITEAEIEKFRALYLV